MEKKIKDIPKEKRPREKLLKLGPQELTDAEILAILIGHGDSTGRSVFQLVDELLNKKKTLRGLAGKSIQEIMQIKGLKEAKAVRLAAAIELARRIASAQENEKLVLMTGTLFDDKTDFSELEKKAKIAKKRANLLTGKTWIRYSISVWDDIRKTAEEVKLKHPAMFPVQLPMRLMECFTTEKDKVILDPFVGIGATVIAAERLGKVGIGVDISKEFIELAKERLAQLSLFDKRKASKKSKLICDDANNLLKHIKPNSIDMVITSPPYWDILSQKRTADSKEVRDYGNKKGLDVSQIKNYQEFNQALKDIFRVVFKVMKPKKYCVINVMDIRKKDKFYPFHVDVADFMREVGFVLDDIIIWNRGQEYSNLRPLGYPSVFRINKIHEFVLIFQKP